MGAPQALSDQQYLGTYMRLAILLIGAPATGKSTLARTLSLCFGFPVVSIGDMIRRKRKADVRFRRATDRAFHGYEAFGGTAYCELVAPEVERLSALSPVIVDGGPGVEGVVDRLDNVNWMAVELTAPSSRRGFRRSERASSDSRPDDQAEWFERRSTVYDTWRSQNDLKIDAIGINTATHDRARTALVASSWISLQFTGSSTDGVQRHKHFGSAGKVQQWNDPVLLLKPGFHYEVDKVIPAIENVLHRHDLYITEVSIWNGDTAQARNNWIAHLGEHLFWGAAASRLDPSGKVGGMEYARGRSIEQVSALWQRASRRAKVGLGRWEARLESGEWMINGHVPALYEEFTSPDHSTLVMRLTRGGTDRHPWGRLRHRLLGATDPVQADRASLRGLAYAGRLPLTGHRVTFGNNAFHLSAGPLEAVRERRIWMLERDASIKDPEPGWNGFQAGDGALSWFEATYETDVDRARLRHICDVTEYTT